MDPGAPQPGDAGNAGPRTANLIDIISSDNFKEGFDRRLEAIPKGDDRRAIVLFKLGGQFNLHYSTSGSLASLDRAIGYTERALEELPKPHNKIDEYVTIYSHLLQRKAEKSQRPDDISRYISGLQLAIGLLKDGSLKEEKKRELGCALFSKFMSQSKDIEDLDTAIRTLEDCVSTQQRTFPQATIYLGAALYHRYERGKQLDDLECAVELLQKGLQAVPRDDADYAPLRDFGLQTLASTCALLSDRSRNDLRYSRLINTLELVISSTPAESKMMTRIKQLHLHLIMALCFREPESLRELFKTLESGIEDEIAENEDPASSFEVPAAKSELFLHEPLSDCRKNFRLAKLQPGTPQDFIQCEISEESIESSPCYEALSYVWGDPKNTVKIRVNGCFCEVTKNLYQALLRLRHPEKERTIWIDALCINQVDLNEKAQQIARMRDIYRGASTVILWLGDPQPQEPPLKPRTDEPGNFDDTSAETPSSEPSPKLTGASSEKTAVPPTRNPSSPGREETQVPTSTEPTVDLPSEDLMRKAEVLLEKLQWMQPVLYGSKPATKMSNEGSSVPMDQIRAMFNSIQKQQTATLLFHNIRFRRLTGPQLNTFNWTAAEDIPSFFSAPQTRTTWPVLGAFALIHCFSRLNHFPELPFFERSDTNISYHQSQAWIQSARILGNILSSQYWDRVWILQEIVLAREPIVHYGAHIMAFNDLVRAGYNFQVHYYGGCCSEWGEKAYCKEHTYWTRIMEGFAKFERLDLLRHSHGTPSVASSGAPNTDISNISRDGPNPSLSLESIMRAGDSRRKATDPRDMVYGILGIVDCDTGIEADYTASVADVFTRAAMHMIQRKDDLSLLSLNYLGKHDKHGLPSWVPDWTSKGHFCPQPYPWYLYNADGDRRRYAQLEDGSMLKVMSIMIDTIKDVTAMRAVSWSDPRKLVAAMEEWRRMAGLDGPDQAQEDLNQASSGPNDREETFWRAVFADVISEAGTNRRFEPRDVAKVRAWWDWLRRETKSGAFHSVPEWHNLRTRPQPDGFHSVTDRFWGATETRKMIFTEGHRMGTGPSAFGSSVKFGDAQIGDEVHVLFGMKTPVILRRMSEQTDRAREAGKRYEFVGPCYLHGIMDGEAMMNEKAVREVSLC